MRSLIIGLGRAGAGLHLPVLRRVRRRPEHSRLFADGPIIVCDPAGDRGTADPEVTWRISIEEASRLLDPRGTIVHLCTPPTARVPVLAELAERGFRHILIEKPLATSEPDLAEIMLIKQRFGLRIVVVAPWLASDLTRRLLRLTRDQRLGELRMLSVVQNKPRFHRSFATHGHPTAFDVELPHSLGVALLLAGAAAVTAASCTDLVLGDLRASRMGCARLQLRHVSGVRGRLVSNLASPVRERRITLHFEHGTATGHYAVSMDDDHAQLSISTDGGRDRTVFRDDSLTTFLLGAYRTFHEPDETRPDDFSLAVQVVRLLSAAKNMSGAAKDQATLHDVH